MTRSLVASDNFNRANGNLSGADGWTQMNTGWGNVAISGNALAAQAEAPYRKGLVRWTGTGTWTADQYAKITLASYAFDNLMHGAVAVRVSNPTPGTTTALNFYYAYLFGNSGSIGGATTKIGKVVNGVNSAALSSVAADGFAIGDTLEIEAEGSTIRVLKNGAVLRSVTDTDIAGSASTSAGTLGGGDDWEGGILTAGGGFQAAWARGSNVLIA